MGQVPVEGHMAQTQPSVIPEAMPATPIFDQAPIDAPPGDAPSNAKLSLEEMLAFKDTASNDSGFPVDQDATTSEFPEEELSPHMLGTSTNGAPQL